MALQGSKEIMVLSPMRFRSKKNYPVAAYFGKDSTSMQIPTFIINLKRRPDRKADILRSFKDHSQFAVHLVEAVEHEIGAVGLWRSILQILEDSASGSDEFIIVCEDDHQFTADYSPQMLQNAVDKAKELDADILLGGVSWSNSALPVAENIFWVDKFSGLQFTIIFRKFFEVLRSAEFHDFDASDYKISTLTDKKFVIYPFISTQKGYGYSDVTSVNNRTGRVEELFSASMGSFQALAGLKEFYARCANGTSAPKPDFGSISIPTFVINLPERTERLAHIRRQFQGRMEFELNIVDACFHEVGAVGLWMSIRKIVALAKEQDEDLIIICEDDHEFTADYSRDAFLSNILTAHYKNADYLSGGTGGASYGMMISRGLFWAIRLLSTQFIVVYSKFYDAILSEPFDESVVADLKLSEMTSNKMVIYPFISVQRDFGYSDITAIHNLQPGMVQNMFAAASRQLDKIRRTQEAYSERPE
ncbi:hypothetical protein [Chitinophaga caseinilytica]|uniref:hypothetical protein n=1 Tax=Chitinophaga caseinilytica TaxID=2267521 RepID=UPI003C2AB7CD